MFKSCSSTFAPEVQENVADPEASVDPGVGALRAAGIPGQFVGATPMSLFESVLPAEFTARTLYSFADYW